jgi:hypothetical protein
VPALIFEKRCRSVRDLAQSAAILRAQWRIGERGRQLLASFSLCDERLSARDQPLLSWFVGACLRDG